MIKEIIKKILEEIYPALLYRSITFSQDREDVVLEAFLKQKKGYKGFYIDVGAHHPFRFSNTALFYNKGWSGINIEPTPYLIRAFRKFRTRDVNLNVGVSDENSILSFFEFDDPALNSFDEKGSLERVANTPYKIVNKTEIKVLKLNDILEEHLKESQKIDFLSIDAEGFDLKVLKSNNWSKFRPEYLLVEGEFDLNKLNENEVLSFLTGKNYKMIGRTLRTFFFKDCN
jgi:FkbM family methyltransferase